MQTEQQEHYYIVRADGVVLEQQFRHLVMLHYPQAKVEMVEPGVARVILPQPYWRMMPSGEEGVFGGLVATGVIQSFRKFRVPVKS